MPYSKGVSRPSLPQVRKLVVASVGLGLLVASSIFGHDLTDASDEVLSVFDGVVGLLTALGVYQVPNAPTALKPSDRSSWGRKDNPGFGPDGQHRI